MNNVGQRIRLKRLELGLTQTELAKKMGYTSKAAISKVEVNDEDMSLPRVKKFADALGVTPGYLMGWEGDNFEINIVDTPEHIKMHRLYDAYSKLDPQVQKIVDGILGLEGE